MAASHQKEEIGKQELAAGSKALPPILTAPGPPVMPLPPTTYSLRGISNQQCKVHSRMKEHRATVRKSGQVQGLQFPS